MRLTLVAALLFAAAPVVAAQAQEFTRDGETYSYAVKREANGAIRLVGKVSQSQAPFDLTIRNRRVDGIMDGKPVAFVVSKTTALALVAEANGAVQTAALND